MTTYRITGRNPYKVVDEWEIVQSTHSRREDAEAVLAEIERVDGLVERVNDALLPLQAELGLSVLTEAVENWQNLNGAF